MATDRIGCRRHVTITRERARRKDRRMADFDSDPVPEPDVSGVPDGATVVALDGSVLGTVREVHRHYLLVAEPDAPHFDFEVPVRAIGRFDGDRLFLKVNREALTEVDDSESARRRLRME
jgi:hypothetical protein